ncbi:MAG: hypothetical protein QF752_03585 [Planctomycetota bacterium]|nr:hypothetical protein [Planctomycetota bacterium]
MADHSKWLEEQCRRGQIAEQSIQDPQLRKEWKLRLQVWEVERLWISSQGDPDQFAAKLRGLGKKAIGAVHAWCLELGIGESQAPRWIGVGRFYLETLFPGQPPEKFDHLIRQQEENLYQRLIQFEKEQARLVAMKRQLPFSEWKPKYELFERSRQNLFMQVGNQFTLLAVGLGWLEKVFPENLEIAEASIRRCVWFASQESLRFPVPIETRRALIWKGMERIQSLEGRSQPKVANLLRFYRAQLLISLHRREEALEALSPPIPRGFQNYSVVRWQDLYTDLAKARKNWAKSVIGQIRREGVSFPRLPGE